MTSTQTGTSLERPLSKGAIFLLACGAGGTIFLFYLFAALSLTLLLAVLGFELVLLLVAARFGLAGVVAGLIGRHAGSLTVFFRSFWLSEGAGARIRLQQSDAPRLFGTVQNLCEKARVRFPDEILLEMNAGAWVRARGYRRGSGNTTLGVGYDLLAGLSEPEMEAVLAHEITHAKLLQRGFTWWLSGGVARSVRLARGLSEIVQASRHARQADELAGLVLKVANFLARQCVRQMAACSRQDEFAADLGAAALTSAGAMRTALIKTNQIGNAMEKVSWRERVSRLQTGEGLSQWILEEVSKSAGESGEQTKAHHFNQYSTHPSLPDRLAALPPAETVEQAASPSAMGLLAEPETIAAKLITEIETVVTQAEAKDTKELGRWVRKIRSRIRLGPLQTVGALGMAAGIVLGGIFCLVAGWSAELLFFLGITLVPGFLCFKFGEYRETTHLPVPDFSKIKAGWKGKNPGEETKVKEIEAELRSRLNKCVYRKERHCLLVTESYNALRECNYTRAHVAARLCLEIASESVEGHLALAVAAAGLGRVRDVSIPLLGAQRLTRLKGPSTFWGLAWALASCGEWWQAEAFLEQVRKDWPEEPTILLLLALCRSHRGKLYTAIANAREACTPRARHTEHSKLLISLLLDAGLIKEAQQRLRTLESLLPQDDELLFSKVRLELLLRQPGNADEATEALLKLSNKPDTRLKLASVYEAARQPEKAAPYYWQALVHGHYPEACLGLARISAINQQKEQARSHALASLNMEKTLGEEALKPLNALGPALTLLLSLEEPVPGCRHWVGTLNGSGPEHLAHACFSVYAKDQGEAEKHMKELLQALKPAGPPSPPGAIGWQLAPNDQQPDTPVTPGVRSVRW